MINTVSELVDEIILDKPLDFETLNFDAIKQVAILGAIEQFQSITANEALSEDDMKLSLIAVIAYLTLENSILWIENHKNKVEK